MLYNSQPNLFDSLSNEAFSGIMRNHASMVEIELITSEEYGIKGKKLRINYSFYDSLFGEILIASTYKGICCFIFSDDEKHALSELENRFPNARFIHKTDDNQKNASLVFTSNWSEIKKIKLHIQATDFQLKVWKELLKISFGSLTTYSNIATLIQKPKAARAVGTAIGSNPIAFIIPCHRVIQSSGKLGGYMWGLSRKTAIINWENAHKEI